MDGVYSSDPKKDPSAKRFERLSHSQALEGGYKVMDATAFALARETSLPIIVFSIAEAGFDRCHPQRRWPGDDRRQLIRGVGLDAGAESDSFRDGERYDVG